MKTISKLIVVLVMMTAGVALASEHQQLEHANIERGNFSSLQRGAQLYVNNCLGCHSLKYQRYERLATDLRIPTAVVKKNLMFTTDKIGNTMSINMPAAGAKVWFGKTPPDLSLIVRAKGVDYLYSYLKGFYRDENRPWGVNNTVFKDVGMPDVLEPLQGLYAKNDQDELIQIKKGSMTDKEYDTAARDLVNFLAYVAEPIRAERIQLGIYVTLFLVVLFLISYALKREFWKDIH